MAARLRGSTVRAIVVLASGVAGAVLAGQPTGVRGIDVLWCAALAAGLAYAGAYASSLALLPAAAAAAALSGSGLGLGLAAAAVVVAAATVGQERPSSRATALSGGLLGLALIERGHGPASAVVTGLIVVPAIVLGSAWQGFSPRRRTRAAWALVGLAAVVLVCTAAGGLAGLRARTDARHGIDALRAARVAATGGDVDTAAELFRAAEQDFGDAGAPLDGFGRLGRLVPGLSQQLAAASTGVDTAGDASSALRRSVRSLHLDDVALQGGSVDLAALAKAEPVLGGVVDALQTTVARLRSVERTGLVAPIRHALDDALDEAEAAARTARSAHDATLQLPDLLGASGPTRFLVLFTSPVEARNRFGFAGAYAVARFDSGHLTIERSGPTNDLVDAAGTIDQAQLQVPARAAPYASYGVSRTWRSITLPVDGRAVTDLAVQMGALSGLGHLDGVVMADPQALAAIVGLVGPIPVPGLDVTLTAANTADFLNRRQYLEFPDQSAARKDKLVEVADAVGARLVGVSLPSVQDLARRFGPLVEQSHLVVGVPAAERPGAAALLHDLGLDGALDLPRQTDLLYVGQRNRVGDKIDLFLSRAVDYDVQVDRKGRLSAKLSVDLTNTAPASGLPDYVIGSAQPEPPPKGTNLTTTLIYTPHELSSLTVDGTAVRPPVLVDGGFLVYQVEVQLGPGEHHRIEAQLTGTAPADPYALRYLPGTLAQPDHLATSITDRRVGPAAVRQDVGAVTSPTCLGAAREPVCER